MNSIYKYGFYVFILASITLFNMWSISRTRSKEDLNVEKNKFEKRILSLLQSNIILKRNIDDVNGYDPLNNINSIVIKKDSN